MYKKEINYARNRKSTEENLRWKVEEKYSKIGKTAWSKQMEHTQVPKRGTGPAVRKGKRSLLASHTRYICSMETTRNSVKVKPGIKVMKIGGKSYFIYKKLFSCYIEIIAIYRC